MNKFFKVSLATAGILMGIGIILCFICALFGGRSFWYYAKNDAYMLSRFEVAGEKFEDVVERLDNAFSSKHGNAFFSWGEEGSTKNLIVNSKRYLDIPHEGQVQAENIERLHLSLGAGRIIITQKESGEETIDVRIQGTGACDYYVEGNTLYMEGFKEKHLLKGDGERNVITVGIPKNIDFDKVEAEVGAGIMEANSLQTGELSIQVGAGIAVLTDMKAGEFLAEIGVGRIEAENAETGNAEILVSMGECVYQGNISGNLKAECDMGNLEMRLGGREEDHNYEIECSAGNITLEGRSTSAFASERNIDNGSDSTFELSCNMGNITVSFEK